MNEQELKEIYNKLSPSDKFKVTQYLGELIRIILKTEMEIKNE